MDSEELEPVDGFTVEREKDYVVLMLLNRYGRGEWYAFEPEDAHTIGLALVARAQEKPPAVE